MTGYSGSSSLHNMNTLDRATMAVLLTDAVSDWSPAPLLASYNLFPHWIRVRSCPFCPKLSYSLSPCLELRVFTKASKILHHLAAATCLTYLLPPSLHFCRTGLCGLLRTPQPRSCQWQPVVSSAWTFHPRMSSNHTLISFKSFRKWHLLGDVHYNQLLGSRTPHTSS